MRPLFWLILWLAVLLSACQTPMPPSPTARELPVMPSGPETREPPSQASSPPVAPSSDKRAVPNGSGPKIISIAPKAEGPGDPTAGIDPNTPMETSLTPKVEPLVKGTLKPYVVNGETVTPMASIVPFSQTGIASWYGKKFHGLKTASGEPYNMFKLTGAHQKLPIPSYVRVTSLETQKSVIVRINDRGPFAHNRIIDLSYAAAKQLDLLKTGSGRVEITLIDPRNPDQAQSTNTAVTTNTSIGNLPSNPAKPASKPAVPSLASSGVYVQVGAFGEELNADRVYQHIALQQPERQSLLNKVYNGKVFQVVLGPYPDHALATQVATDIREQLQLPAYIFNRP